MKVLRVRNWDEYFENNRTRELKKLAWVPVPNKMDGCGYRTLMAHPNGVTVFGAWVLLLEIASKCAPRGYLVRESGDAHDAQTLSIMTGAPQPILTDAISVLLSRDIGWLESVEIANPAGGCGDPAGGCDNPAPSCDAGCGKAPIERKKGKKGKERKERYIHRPSLIPDEGGTDSAADPRQEASACGGRGRRITSAQLESIYLAYPRRAGKGAALRAIRRALEIISRRPGVDDPVQWLSDRVSTYAAARNAIVNADPSARAFTPYPSTWFNQGRYDDEPEPALSSDEFNTSIEPLSPERLAEVDELLRGI